LNSPFLASSKYSFTISNTYPIFAHEVGWNHVEDGIEFPIVAYAESNQFTLGSFSSGVPGSPPIHQMRVRRVVPDILMGDVPLEFQIKDYPYLNSASIDSQVYQYYNNQGLVPTNDMVTSGTLTIKSNLLDGWFQTGTHSIFYIQGTVRPSVPSGDPLPPS
jgi:hypothetical protein